MKKMSKLFVEATLRNGSDESAHREVRQLVVKMMADTGSEWTVITEDAQKVLQLTEPRTRLVTVVGGKQILCKVIDYLKVCLTDDLYVTTSALVIPGQHYCILGVTTLEMMGLAVDPSNQKLLPVYGEGIIGGIGC
jgi:predicted aspartyl protease